MDLKTNKGEQFNDLMESEKLFLVFLRHFGCTFCRETMAELALKKRAIESEGYTIVLVHMVQPEMADDILKVYDLDGLSHVSDVHQYLYRRFGLGKTSLRAMFGIKNWWRALVAGLFKGHLVGKPAGDPFQMPGVFVVNQNRILNKFTYRYVSDLPDFVKLARAV